LNGFDFFWQAPPRAVVKTAPQVVKVRPASTAPRPASRLPAFVTTARPAPPLAERHAEHRSD
jgi:hypothetical protein